MKKCKKKISLKLIKELEDLKKKIDSVILQELDNANRLNRIGQKETFQKSEIRKYLTQQSIDLKTKKQQVEI